MDDCVELAVASWDRLGDWVRLRVCEGDPVIVEDADSDPEVLCDALPVCVPELSCVPLRVCVREAEPVGDGVDI